MNIALNATFMNATTAGTATYVLGLLTQLAKSEHQFMLILAEGVSLPIELPDNVRIYNANVSLDKSWWKKYLWEIMVLPKLCKENNIDVLHSLNGTGSWWGSMKRVVTIHDLIFEHEKQDYSLLTRLFLRLMFQVTAWRSHAVLTVSEHAKADISEKYSVRKDKITVTYLGCGREDHRGQDEIMRSEKPIALMIGTAHHYKQFDLALRACSLIQKDFPLQVVHLGSIGINKQYMLDVARDYKVDVQWEGYVTDQEVHDWYRKASVALIPSRYEGFGLPVLEAFMHHCPVIIAPTPALVEVAAGAAVVVDVTNEQEFADAISRFLDDEKTRQHYISLGNTRLQDFNWETTAAQTLNVYEQLHS